MQKIRDYMASFRRFSRNARLYLAGTFFVGFGFGTFWVLFNLYLKELGLGEAAIGRIITAGAAGTFLISLPAALLLDRVRTRSVLRIAAAVASAAYAVQVAPVPMIVVFIAAGVAGSAFAVQHIATAPYFMRNSSPAERLNLFGLNAAIEVLAGVTGAAGGAQIPKIVMHFGGTVLDGYRIALFAAALLVILALVPYSMMQESPRPVGRIDLRKYFSGRDWPLIRRLLMPRFAVGLGAGLIIPFMNLYFRNRFQLEPGPIGVIFAVSQILTMIGFLTGPVIARRIGMIRAAVTTELMSIPFFLAMAFTGSLPLAILAFWFRGALMNMNQPISDNFAMEMVGENQHAVTNSLGSLVWNGAWMISAQVGGWMIERHGFKPPIVIAVLLYVTASVLFLSFFRRAERDVIEPRRRAEQLASLAEGQAS